MATKIKFDDYRKNEEPTDFRSIPHPLKPKPGNDKRAHFRIVRCCLNCKYHFSFGPNPLRMGCTWPYKLMSKARQLKWPKGKPLNADFVKSIKPTHGTCCCKSHTFTTSTFGGIKTHHVTFYCGAEFFGDDEL